METSELYKTGTELEYNLQKLYEEESGKPENRGDPTFGDRFLAEKVNPLLDQWGESASTDHGKQLATTLKASIRNKVFNHVAAGQAEMDAAHVDDNLSQQMNLEAAGLITDPSETNLRATLGRVENTIQGVTAIIPDVGMREQSATYYLRKYRDAMVVARYEGVANSIKNQIAETGGETSPALEQLNKDIKAQLGFQYISPEQQTKISELGEQAVRQGKALYDSGRAEAKREEDEAIQGAILRAEVSMFKDNGAGGVTVVSTPALLDAMQQISQMPGAERHADDIRALGNALHTATQDQITGKERVTNQEVYLSLFARVGSTTNPLTKAEVDKQVKNLSDKDWQFLRTAAPDAKGNDPKINHAMATLNGWFNDIKPAILKSNMYGGITNESAILFAKFKWEAQNRVRKAIETGQASPDDVVKILTNPNNHLGLWRDMQPYARTNKQGLQSVIDATKPSGGGDLSAGPVKHTAPPPRKPGESSDAYLKRTGQ